MAQFANPPSGFLKYIGSPFQRDILPIIRNRPPRTVLRSLS